MHHFQPLWLFCLLIGNIVCHEGNNDWVIAGLDVHNTNYVKDNVYFTAESVPRMLLKWTFVSNTPVGALHASSFDGQPSVFGDYLIAADTLGVVYALNITYLSTKVNHTIDVSDHHNVIWSRNLSTSATDYGKIEGFDTTPLIMNGKVYLSYRNVFCLDLHTGSIIWSVPLYDDGLIGPDGRPTQYWSYSGNPSGDASRNIVFIGVGSLQNMLVSSDLLNPNDTKLTARGNVVGFDGSTGRELWRVFTTSYQGVAVPQYAPGCTVWSTAGVDKVRHTIYLGSGQAYTPGINSNASNNYGYSPLCDSILAIDYLSGSLVWSKQLTSLDIYGYLYPDGATGSDGHDWDVDTHANLFSLYVKPVGARETKLTDMVGIGDKRGNYYIFPRDNPQHGHPDEVVMYVNVSVDIASQIGGFQGTPMYHDGILYTATIASINETDGERISYDIGGLFTLSTKFTAIDVRHLVNTGNLTASTIWSLQEEPNLLQFTFGSVDGTNDVFFHTSVAGFLNAYNTNGTLIAGSNRVPSPGTFEFFPGFFVDAPLYTGVTISGSNIILGFGASFELFAAGGLICYGFSP